MKNLAAEKWIASYVSLIVCTASCAVLRRLIGIDLVGVFRARADAANIGMGVLAVGDGWAAVSVSNGSNETKNANLNG